MFFIGFWEDSHDIFISGTNWSTSSRSSQRSGRKHYLCCAIWYFYSDFSLSQMFLMLFRDSLGWTETKWNVLMCEDFLYNFRFLYETGLTKPVRVSRLWLFVELQFDIGTGFLCTWLRQEILYSLWDYVHDRRDMFLAFIQILNCRFPIWEDLLWRKRFLDDLLKFLKFGSMVYVPSPPFFYEKTVEPILWRVVYVFSFEVWNDRQSGSI